MDMALIAVIATFKQQLIRRGSNALIDAVSVSLKSILAIQDKTSTTDKNVEKLIKKHYQLGLKYLENAKHAASDSIKEHSLRMAIDNFMNTVELDSIDYVLNSYVMIASCFLILNERENALRYFEKSYFFLGENFDSLSSQRGEIAVKASGLETPWWVPFSSYNCNEMKIHVAAAREIYEEFYSIASILNDQGLELELPSEMLVDTFRRNYERMIDLGPRGM